jgi:hypothetical protein
MLGTPEADICKDEGNYSIQITGIHQNTYRTKRYGHILTINTRVNPKEGAEHETKEKFPRCRPRSEWKQ